MLHNKKCINATYVVMLQYLIILYSTLLEKLSQSNNTCPHFTVVTLARKDNVRRVNVTRLVLKKKATLLNYLQDEQQVLRSEAEILKETCIQIVSIGDTHFCKTVDLSRHVCSCLFSEFITDGLSVWRQFHGLQPTPKEELIKYSGKRK